MAIARDPTVDKFFSGNELAEEFGITARALRFYEAKGLLSPGRAGVRRVYTRRDRGRLQLILRGKRLGFSLADIKEYLSLYSIETDQTEQLMLLDRKVRRRMYMLRQQEAALEKTLAELEEIAAQVSRALVEKGVVRDFA